MKKLHFILVMFLARVLNIMPVLGQSDSKNDKVVADSKTAKAEFLKKDALMKGLFEIRLRLCYFSQCRQRWDWSRRSSRQRGCL